MGKWIGVDLDGTLAQYHGAMGEIIGEPIKPMLTRVREWLSVGREVRIFTARAGDPTQLPLITAWLLQHGLPPLEITNIKDFDMIALYDDKAFRVKRNVGYICGTCFRLGRGREEC
ncbi:hypothetical protein [Chromobacterium violaceum]|uniref:hypothetical protein n=1 Tax=Chromobacterium violaceum TaxID=536 RepID=UPI0009DB0746|nr:hypothetical protein [Chromobacterium violaceum]OQS30401.1 hypothetical protein B0T41_00135 [Chromobacterium violaceum]